MKCFTRNLILLAVLATAVPAFSAGKSDEVDPLFQDETPKPTQVKIAPLAAAPKDNEGKIKLALELEKRGDYSGVIETLRPVSDSLSRRGLVILARAFGKSGDTMNESRILELCLAKNPKDYYVQTALAETYSRAKRSEEAIAAFREARQMNPKYEPAYEGLLKELEKVGEAYEARIVINDMIKLFGSKPRYYTDLCRLYSADAFLEKAIETCEKAIKLDPKSASNYMFLGVSLKDKEEQDRALKILSDGAKRFPASEPLNAVLAEVEYEQKNFIGSYKHYKQAFEADPKSSRAAIGLANSSFELQKYDESIEAFVKSCNMNRKYSKEFRIALGKLRARKDTGWIRKFEAGLERCE